MEYKEIFKLKEMLKKEKIPFEWIDRGLHFNSRPYESNFDWGFQIIVRKPESTKRLISVIEGFGTYGNESDLLEIMDYVEETNGNYDVLGWLTAKDVLEMILKHYKGDLNS